MSLEIGGGSSLNCQGCEVEKIVLFTSIPCLALYEATVLHLFLCQHTHYVCCSPV
jgi:hypothetical protein